MADLGRLLKGIEELVGQASGVFETNRARERKGRSFQWLLRRAADASRSVSDFCKVGDSEAVLEPQPNKSRDLNGGGQAAVESQPSDVTFLNAIAGVCDVQ